MKKLSSISFQSDLVVDGFPKLVFRKLGFCDEADLSHQKRRGPSSEQTAWVSLLALLALLLALLASLLAAITVQASPHPLIHIHSGPPIRN